MNQVTECINCGWKQDGTILTHDEYVKSNPMRAWLCYRQGKSVGDVAAVRPPRPQDADPVLDADGNVTGYTTRSFKQDDQVTYAGELPCNETSHTGTVTAVEPDAAGGQVVTVEFDCGLTQDILSSELQPAE